MIIDGEKYACEACVRGHRVSNCQHSDRPLQHINKKGRPISQCQHCRSQRKSRAAHVKCDCGERTSKCAHLQPALEGHRDTCCCNHGGRCTCCHKKEAILDTVPETNQAKSLGRDSGATPRPPIRRRRANTVHSDGPLAFDQHGNIRTNGKAGRVGAKGSSPYHLGRSNPSPGATGAPASNRTEEGGDGIADPSARRGTGPHRTTAARQQRLVRSEAASPLLQTTQGQGSLGAQLPPPLDLSGIEYPSYTFNSASDLFTPSAFSEHDGPMLSAGLGTDLIDWSHMDRSALGSAFGSSSYSQTAGRNTRALFEWGSGSDQPPTLAPTTSTSGEVSEVEDNYMPSELDFDPFASSDANFSSSGVLFSNGADLSSIGYDSFQKSASGKFVATSSAFDDIGSLAGGTFNFENDPVFWGQQFNDNAATYDASTDGVATGADTWAAQS